MSIICNKIDIIFLSLYAILYDNDEYVTQIKFSALLKIKQSELVKRISHDNHLTVRIF